VWWGMVYSKISNREIYINTPHFTLKFLGCYKVSVCFLGWLEQPQGQALTCRLGKNECAQCNGAAKEQSAAVRNRPCRAHSPRLGEGY
jgi:hypothetical protein